jgi:hypothetical protein
MHLLSLIDEKNGKLVMYEVDSAAQLKLRCTYDLFLSGKFALSVVDNLLVVHNIKSHVW